MTIKAAPTKQDFENATKRGRAMQARALQDPRSRATFDQLHQSITMRELRKKSSLTQHELAEILGCNQSRITQIENQSDFLVSSLTKFVEAVGATLTLTVTYPDGNTTTLALHQPSQQ